jgi:hypothetical protein
VVFVLVLLFGAGARITLKIDNVMGKKKKASLHFHLDRDIVSQSFVCPFGLRGLGRASAVFAGRTRLLLGKNWF